MYERLENFYLEYHKILKEAMEFAEPDYIINIHSHDPESLPRVGMKREIEGDVLLYHPNIMESVVLD